MAAKAAMRVFAAGGKVKDSMGREGTFRQWNRLADSMTGFHSRFEREFNDVYDQAAGGFHKHGMSLRAFLNSAQVVNRHLDGHHRIEEAYIFPLLAHKMPQFKPGRKGQDGEHIAYHRKIHEGLDKYDAYLNKAMRDQSSYSSEELRAIMDSLRKPLFDHLDEEVRDLGAGSMIRHGFTLQELDRVPM
jgi:hypothetical protein